MSVSSYEPDVDEAIQETSDDDSEAGTGSDLNLSYEDETSGEDESSGDDGSAGDNCDDEWRRLSDVCDRGPMPIHFSATPGHKNVPQGISSPIEYFSLFFTDEILDKIVEETNRYSDQYVEEHEEDLATHPKSRVHQWLHSGHTHKEEMRAFLGVCLNMGIVNKPTIESFWDTKHPSINTPWFSQHFKRNRFQLLLKFLHFNDNSLYNEENPDHALYKIQPIIEHFQAKFLQYFHPGKDLSLDESLIAFKGLTPHLRQYMRNKHHAKFGIKMWCVCDVNTGYTCTYEIYAGKTREPPVRGPVNITQRTVIRLLNQARVLNLGHNVGFDSYFSSPALFQDLYDRSTTATGTVRSNRLGLPHDMRDTRVLNNEVAEWRHGNLLCVKYRDGKKEPVHLISTSCRGGFTQVTTRKNERVTRPNIVCEYNKIMGGVDLKDKKLYAYLSERRTLKWTTKVAFYLFGTAVLNSYIIYKVHTNGNVMSRLDFMLSIIDDLVKDFNLQRAQRRPREDIERQRQPLAVLQMNNQLHYEHRLEKLPKKKLRNCVAGHDRRVRSNYICRKCNVGLCVTCYHDFHSNNQ